MHAADGAVRFLVKLSPALEQVDSSSGALGSAARAAVDALVPVIAQAPFAAGRHDELIALTGGDPRPMWHDLLWVGRCKVASGEIDEAIDFMTKAVNAWTPMAGLARFAEGVLLQAGHRTDRVALRIQMMLRPATREVRWVGEILSLPA